MLQLTLIPIDLFLPQDSDYVLRYLNSPSEFLEKIQANKHQKILACGFSPKPKENHYADLMAMRGGDIELPGSGLEIESITEVFGRQVNSFIAARRKDFFDNSKNAAVIHLALHSISDKNLPSFSHFIFSDTSNDSGKVYLHEIQNCNLDADLVCLSSCSSGAGRFLDGEGTGSLGRTFQAAGCINIVQSLWPVSGAATAQLMKFFYINLKNGLPKPLALTQAKKEFLETVPVAWRHPYYWAGFIYFGQDAPLQLSQSSNMVWWILGCVVLFLLLIILTRRIRPK